MGVFDWLKNKQEEKRKVKEGEDELRRQAEEEVSEEVIKIRKEKIKQDILAEARGEKKADDGKGSKLLKALGNEFKQSNLGNNEQMEKLLGKQGQAKGTTTSDGLKTDRLMEMIGSKKTANTNVIQGKSINTNRNFAELLGGQGASNEKLRDMLGKKKEVKK